MAGHSQFKNIMYRKGAQDAKRAKVFTKLIRELTVAAKSGAPDPDMNPRLRSAVAAAKAANMPKDNISRAIKRGAGGGDDANFEEMRYEGYGPGGVALIVEVLTDNRNRTASNVRAAFNKHGGTLGESGSVGFLFERVGHIHYGADTAVADDMLEAVLEAGAEDMETNGEGYEITCVPDELNAVREALAERFGEAGAARLDWKPQTTVTVAEDTAGPLFGLLEALEDDDDVQRVAANFEVADEVMERLGA
ncbi:MAG: YebC/PmpR family DNA-binding transcriptional regulator [Rhodospirillales bacterium]|jgi:YebC/PmpR family DNA-binding regulatory protein|nr:YebC/PmpR family DNA-binding transcriptional regulator [Rhodospirillales bacterium]MDP6774833.1 YebC/PmpR family DNA-binding transcriptional regulator [Rhodospirillales bacterium]|tara:strand:- start:185 stop:934 length:750 start_codon:yes stop_codon:yes gene_type:complete